jgi:hypothetical protein
MGHWLLFASAVSYARFVVLDAQGLIPIRRRKTEKAPAKPETVKSTSQAPAAVAAAKQAAPTIAAATRSTIQTAKTPADSNHWVDGSRPERDRYDP